MCVASSNCSLCLDMKITLHKTCFSLFSIMLAGVCLNVFIVLYSSINIARDVPGSMFYRVPSTGY